MATSYGKKVQSDNKHLEDLANAQFVHIDGSTTPVVVSATACNLARVIVNTKGIGFVVRTGSRQIATFATTSPENTYRHGVYCENGLTVDVSSGTGSVTIVFN